MKTINVKLYERVVLFWDARPVKVLGPGRYRLWRTSRLSEARFDTRELVFDAWPQVRAVLPSDWFQEVTVADSQRAVVYEDGRPRVYLRPGVYGLWTLEPSVKLSVYPVAQPLHKVTREFLEVVPKGELVEAAVGEYERGFKYERGELVDVLEPGRYYFWTDVETNVSVEVVDTRDVLLYVWPEKRGVLPAEWYQEVTVGDDERAVVFEEGRPREFLRPGMHRVWRLDPSVTTEMYSVKDPMPTMTKELLEVIPSSEMKQTVVREYERGLKFVRGKLRAVLEPGQYYVWSHPEAEVTMDVVDVREQQVTIAAQELMTKDKVTLRVTLTFEYAVTDVAKAAVTSASPRDSLYLMVQLAARDYVAGVTLDELLEGRDSMTRYLEKAVKSQANGLGVTVQRVGVKDVVLPGDMKLILSKVIEAEKESIVSALKRREETAMTRTMASSAKVISAHPVMMRLKELEAYKDIAERISEVKLVVGSDGVDKLLPITLMGKDQN